jgi:hypothetical protein
MGPPVERRTWSPTSGTSLPPIEGGRENWIRVSDCGPKYDAGSGVGAELLSQVSDCSSASSGDFVFVTILVNSVAVRDAMLIDKLSPRVVKLL